MDPTHEIDKTARINTPMGLGQAGWETVFRTAMVPMYVEDISLLRQAIAEVKARGVEDFGAWLEAHPEFISKALAMVGVVDVNRAAVTLNAASGPGDMGNIMDRILLPESLTGSKGLLKAIERGDRYFEGECQYRALDGRHYFTMNQAWIPSPDKPGDLLVLATIDITPLKRAQQDLAESEERYRLLVETAHDVIIRHDLSGNVTFVNRAGLELTGFSEEEFLGLNAMDIIPADLQEEILERKKQRAAGNGGVFLYETVFLGGHGRRVPMEVSSTLIPGSVAGGEPQVLLVARDISERRLVEREQRELEARLRDAQKLESLGVLAGGIAHDFNNLLVTIMGNAELVRGDLAEGSANHNSLEAVLEAAGRAADLCRQMQAYAGRGQMSVRSADMNRLILEIKRLLQVSVSKRSTLHFELSEDLPPVLIDEPQIRQVLMNLVSNAAESLGDRGGEIMVRTLVRELTPADQKRVVGGNGLAAGPYVWCEVRDSGCGMEVEVAERMFDPFFTTKFAGRGLGMSAALGIVKGHEGGFVMDTDPSRGTTISFLLPVHVEETATPRRRRRRSPEMAAGADLKGKLILVVDDEAPVRTVGESFLRRLGCKVLSAADGYEAVRIFGERHRDIHAVLLDFTMAGMDGMSAYRRLRAIRSDIPVILSSGHDLDRITQKTKGFDIAGFVAKPYSLKSMRQVLAGVLSDAAE